MSQTTKAAVFGLQCFWGSEVKFGILKGVISTSVGYTGGTTPDPTYRKLSDHTEVVRVVFDHNIITYEQLLDTFWSSHDPTFITKRQYMSAIFYDSEDHKLLAEKSMKDKQKQLSAKMATKILSLNKYYLAEDYHQKYFLRKHRSLVAKLNLTDRQLIDSPLATKLNAFCAGYGSVKDFEEEVKKSGIGLSEDNKNLVKRLIKEGKNLGEC